MLHLEWVQKLWEDALQQVVVFQGALHIFNLQSSPATSPFECFGESLYGHLFGSKY